jgi:hypothetical protein
VLYADDAALFSGAPGGVSKSNSCKHMVTLDDPNRMLLFLVLGSLPFPAEGLLKSVRPSVRVKELENFRNYYLLTYSMEQSPS